MISGKFAAGPRMVCSSECLIKGKVQKKKNKKKLTNVSFVCMYVVGNNDMLVFSSVFSPTVVLTDNFPRSQGKKKTEKKLTNVSFGLTYIHT